MAAQQPAIGGYLHGANAPPPNAAPITLLQLQGLLDQFENRIMARFEHIPIQLYNSKLPTSYPLEYPPGVFQNFMPRTKADLERLTAQQCQQTAAGLGLPALPQGTLVADRRRQIRVFLGAL